MKFKLFDKVKTQHMDGEYNNAEGTIIEILMDIDTEPVYMVKYDVPPGDKTEAMFKESDLIVASMKKFTITFAATGGIDIFANSEEEAKTQFNAMDGKELLDELEENGIEITDCFVEDENRLYRAEYSGEQESEYIYAETDEEAIRKAHSYGQLFVLHEVDETTECLNFKRLVWN